MDEFRKLVEGRLTASQEADLRARCDGDPALQAALDEFLEAHALTKAAEVVPPVCRVHFEEIESRLDSEGRTRALTRAAAAIFVLAVSTLTWAFWPETATPTPNANANAAATFVALASIPLSPEDTPPVSPEIPEFLCTYRPVNCAGIQWLTSLENAKAASKVSGRPILLFLQHPTCPACKTMLDDTYGSPDVQKRLLSFIPAKINVMEASPETRALMKQGWPWSGVLDADGKVVLAFPGLLCPPTFMPRADESLRLAGEATHTWKEVNTLVAALLAAIEDENGGWLGDAHGGYYTLLAENPTGPIRVEAEQGLRRIAQRARVALLGARDLSESEAGVQAALAALETEIVTFAGTPYAKDLAAVRRSIEAHSRFPDLR
jgi:Thioredoxin-like